MSDQPIIDGSAEPAPSPQAWGRVDDAGTVYVRTADGERVVGSWMAGSPDEALAYYTRRYDNLVVEISLLERRIKAGGVEPDAALASIGRLREQVDSAAAVGDLAALTKRLDAAVGAVDERRGALRAEKAAAKAGALAAREAIVTEAEGLATSTSWKATGDRFRALLEEWKAAPRIDRGPEQALWKRFSAARTAFDRARRAHFASLDDERAEAKAVKERIVSEAEALRDSSDWAATSRAFRDLMARWKAAGRAGKGVDDALWERFRSAQDAFFARRNAENAEKDEELRANLVQKEALAAQAEALLPISDLGAAKSALRDIARRWESVGHVPRDDRARVEGRLRAVEDAVRAAEQERWRRSDPAARARASAAVDQLRTSIEKLERQAADAEAGGRTAAAAEAREAIAARQEWLVEAEKALAEFSG